jgi:hypothetical protein
MLTHVFLDFAKMIRNLMSSPFKRKIYQMRVEQLIFEGSDWSKDTVDIG